MVDSSNSGTIGTFMYISIQHRLLSGSDMALIRWNKFLMCWLNAYITKQLLVLMLWLFAQCLYYGAGTGSYTMFFCSVLILWSRYWFLYLYLLAQCLYYGIELSSKILYIARGTGFGSWYRRWIRIGHCLFVFNANYGSKKMNNNTFQGLCWMF
jgi:hypothetical protein